LFSVAAFSQLQWSAACFPHEQVASLAQAHPAPPSERPQQVEGTTEDMVVGCDEGESCLDLIDIREDSKGRLWFNRLAANKKSRKRFIYTRLLTL